MVDLPLGSLIEKLGKLIYEYSKDQVRWQTGMQNELEKLRKIQPQIQAIVSAYSQGQIENQGLSDWFWQLRDAVDEADDVLDEIEYRKLGKRVKSMKKRVVEITKRALKMDPNLKKLEVALQNLNEISAKVSTLLPLLQRAEQQQEQQQQQLHRRRETGSEIKTVLLGRREQEEDVRRWLRNTNQTPSSSDTTDLYRNLSLLSVVGHGGMGKTTLLQHVYKEAALLQGNVSIDGMTEGFHFKTWVCVSTNFDPKTVIANILENKRTHSDSLAVLQSSLQSEATSKKFLLVLDDIWEADEEKWGDVLAPLQYGNAGSKILISSRDLSVASMFEKMIKNNQKLLLTGLEKKECLQLFNKHAFAPEENPHEFKFIIKKIVQKLSGCPLVIKVIAGILKSYEDKSSWANVLNTNIGNIESGRNDFLPILKLSYTLLPDYLQNCFKFCSIFPQDYEFDKDDLVRMWIAVGFIQSSNSQGVTLEVTGRRYFNILVQKSLFDKFLINDHRVHYKMHDLLHEVAQSVSRKECLRVAGDEGFSIPPTIRHMSITTNGAIEAIFKERGEFKNLRSLFLSFDEMYESIKFTDVLSTIFKASKSIRFLVISTFDILKMPETIKFLIHLRYLKVRCTGSFKPPRSISYLYHLQFLISEWLENLEMDNIVWKACNWLQGIINCSIVYITISPNLKYLTGRQDLKISENCQLIMDLLFIKDPSILLMEPLKSICSISSLTIKKNNLLVSIPSETEEWFLQHRSSLTELEFRKLQSLQSLPSNLESLSSLETLEVSIVPHLKLLPNLPASLKGLDLRNLESLQCLPSLSTISSLVALHLENIPLLESLPNLPSSLKNLFLEKLKSLQYLPSSLSNISSLQRLYLTEIPLLKSLPDLPPSLGHLHLRKLENLVCLPSCLPTSLESLSIVEVPRLLELPDIPASLENLSIRDCHPQLMERHA